MTEIEALKKRIEELEAEVAKLKAQPHSVVNNHYHYPPVVHHQEPDDQYRYRPKRFPVIA